MTCKINFRKSASLLLGILASSFGFSQEAENVFHNEYSKLSFVYQPSMLNKGISSNQDGSAYPTMKFTDVFSHQFGVYYNFAQYRNLNFKTGLIGKTFNTQFELNISDSDVGNNKENFLNGYELHNQFIFSIPLKTDYYIKLNEKVNLTLGGGLSLNLFTGMSEPEKLGVAVEDAKGKTTNEIFLAIEEGQNNINFSYELSAGVQYKTKFALLELSMFTNNTIYPYYSVGDYKIYNLANSPDKIGDYMIKSSFYGISLNIAPKKGWLKKNK